MDITTLLAAPILLLVLLSSSSTAKRVVCKRSVEGLALSTVTLSLLCALTWLVYGIGNHHMVQTATSAVWVAAWTVVLWVARCCGHVRARYIGLGVFAYGALAAAITLGFGLQALGLTVTVLSFVTRAPQLRKALLTPGGDGISIAAITFDTLQCVMWIAMGVSLADPWMLATSAYGFGASLFMVVRTLGARRSDAPTTIAAFELAA